MSNERDRIIDVRTLIFTPEFMDKFIQYASIKIKKDIIFARE
jgi:hypothetical protein